MLEFSCECSYCSIVAVSVCSLYPMIVSFLTAHGYKVASDISKICCVGGETSVY